MSKINAGTVNIDDEIVYVTKDLKVQVITAHSTQVFPLPDDTILCWVNNVLKVNRILNILDTDPIDEVIEKRKKEFEDLRKK